MAHVICQYVVDDGECFDELFLEGTFKRVEWDGMTLYAGGRTIHSSEHFRDIREGRAYGYFGGATDIKYLKIDDKVYIGD